jgi:hypothetical protein
VGFLFILGFEVKKFSVERFFCLHKRAEFLGTYLGLARIEENNKIGSTSTVLRRKVKSNEFRQSTLSTMIFSYLLKLMMKKKTQCIFSVTLMLLLMMLLMI